MFNYQSQFLTFIQFSSKILGIFSQKLVLVANGWHLWLSTALIGIQEKCHRTTCVPSCLKLWNGHLFLFKKWPLDKYPILYKVIQWTYVVKMTTCVQYCLKLWNGRTLWKWPSALCSILSLVMEWKIFLKMINCSLFHLVSSYEVDDLWEKWLFTTTLL